MPEQWYSGSPDQELGSFIDPYSSANMGDKWTGSGIPGLAVSWFTGRDLNEDYNRTKERANLASARAWDEYMSGTQYQRMVKDLERAGLNPWLAVQNGVSAGSNTSTASSSGSSAKTQSGNEKMVAAILNFIAKMIASSGD